MVVAFAHDLMLSDPQRVLETLGQLPTSHLALRAKSSSLKLELISLFSASSSFNLHH
jgi:hypothetical protein